MSDQSRLRCAEVRQLDELAGHLTERPGGGWCFAYLDAYTGPPISLTLPVRPEPYESAALPPALEGLLPEGLQLEALLRKLKIDRHNTFRQLVTVGADLVGSLTIHEVKPKPEGGS
jgi:serine/threonine-protein kinase HipA